MAPGYFYREKYTVVPPYPWFQLSTINLSPEADDPHSDKSLEGQLNAVSQCLHIIPLTSSHHVGILPSHIITRQVNTIQCILRKGRPHSHNLYYTILL